MNIVKSGYYSIIDKTADCYNDIKVKITHVKNEVVEKVTKIAKHILLSLQTFLMLLGCVGIAKACLPWFIPYPIRSVSLMLSMSIVIGLRAIDHLQ